MPEDFASFAWTMSVDQLRKKYVAGQTSVQRWRRELGGEPQVDLSIPPADFKARASRWTIAMLRRHYGVGETRIRTWLRITGAEAQKYTAPVRRTVPADFAEVAATTSQTAMIQHYRADVRTIKRWFEETGVTPLVFDNHAPKGPRAKGPSVMVFRGHAQRPFHRDLRQITMYDEAADILRRERFIVYRCDERGRYAEKGDHWRIGNTLVTPDDLLRRADRYRERVA